MALHSLNPKIWTGWFTSLLLVMTKNPQPFVGPYIKIHPLSPGYSGSNAAHIPHGKEATDGFSNHLEDTPHFVKHIHVMMVGLVMSSLKLIYFWWSGHWMSLKGGPAPSSYTFPADDRKNRTCPVCDIASGLDILAFSGQTWPVRLPPGLSSFVFCCLLCWP